MEGSVGTPARVMSCFAAIFEDMASIASGGGPTHTRPPSMTARAKSPDSDRKP